MLSARRDEPGMNCIYGAGGGSLSAWASVSVCTTGTSIIVPLMLSPALIFIPAVCHSRGGWLHMNESLTKHSKTLWLWLNCTSSANRRLASLSMPGQQEGQGEGGDLSLSRPCGGAVELWAGVTLIQLC